MTATASLSARQGLFYGLMGLPLAFVALPLYVILPNHYAREFDMPLATLGAVLLGARLFDAFIDPVIGRWTDRLYARSVASVLRFAAVAALLLAAGFALLMFPPVRTPQGLIACTTVLLVITYAAYSALSVAHQCWGAMLGGDETLRSRIVAWREGLGLVGVLLASVMPIALGLPATVAIFWIALLVGWLAWSQAVRPTPSRGADQTTYQDLAPEAGHGQALLLPFRRPAFRRLMAVFVLNGIASAVPATLVLFFVQDRLQVSREIEPIFLGSYFLFAALSIPLWLKLVKRIGLARSWLGGMALAIAVFVWATQLGAGDAVAFVIVCALSGAALGADLALPGAMLAGVIQAAGDRGLREGAYVGWWNFATKLNLALAAGLALPLLALFGYAPGTRDSAALQVLTLAYCVLPCLLKLAAAMALYTLIIRPSTAQPTAGANP